MRFARFLRVLSAMGLLTEDARAVATHGVLAHFGWRYERIDNYLWGIPR